MRHRNKRPRGHASAGSLSCHTRSYSGQMTVRTLRIMQPPNVCSCCEPDNGRGLDLSHLAAQDSPKAFVVKHIFLHDCRITDVICSVQHNVVDDLA